MHAKQRRLSDATAIQTAFARARIIRSGEYRQSPPYPAGNPVPRYDLEHIPVVLTHFVIAGLDPAIHPLRKKFLRRMMDHPNRVYPIAGALVRKSGKPDLRGQARG